MASEIVDPMREALQEAIAALGGPTAAADALEEKQSTVSMWLVRGRVSDKAALKLATKSGVSVHRLRSDIFGPAPKSKRAA